MTQQEKRIVEQEVLKLDLKVKRFWIKALKELLGILGGIKIIFTPSRSKVENGFKLWCLGMILGAVLIIVIILKT